MVNLNVHLGHDATVGVVDVSEGRASVAIISCSKGAPSTVLASGHSTLSLEHHAAAEEIASIGQLVAEAGAAALRDYQSAGHRAPIARVYAVLHAPWVRSEEVRARKRFEHETRISDPMVSELAKEALEASRVIDRSRLFEAAVTHIELSGYTVQEVAGKTAQSIEVVSLVSDCDSAARDTVQTAVHTLFPVAEIVWRSSLRAALSVIRDEAQYSQSVVVEVGMNTTHIVALRAHGIIQETVAEGVRSILTRVAPGKIPDETLSSMRMLALDACSSEACEAVEKALVLAEPELARVFGEALAHMAAERKIPNDLILVSQTDMEPFLSRFFSRIDFSQFTVTTLPLAVHTPADLSLTTYLSSEHLDPSLAFACSLVNIEGNA